MTDYKEKYLKYKNKYLSLKKQQVGSLGIDQSKAFDGGVIKFAIQPTGNYSILHNKWVLVGKTSSLVFNTTQHDFIINVFVKKILPALIGLDPKNVEEEIVYSNHGSSGVVLTIRDYAIKIVKVSIENEITKQNLRHELVSNKLIKKKKSESTSPYRIFISDYYYSLFIGNLELDDIGFIKINNIFSDDGNVQEKLTVLSDLGDLDDLGDLNLGFIFTKKGIAGFDHFISLYESKKIEEMQIQLYKAFVCIAGALIFLYENKLIHFDVKFENCILVNNNGVEIYQLIDFGSLINTQELPIYNFSLKYTFLPLKYGDIFKGKMNESAYRNRTISTHKLFDFDFNTLSVAFAILLKKVTTELKVQITVIIDGISDLNTQLQIFNVLNSEELFFNIQKYFINVLFWDTFKVSSLTELFKDEKIRIEREKRVRLERERLERERLEKESLERERLERVNMNTYKNYENYENKGNHSIILPFNK